MRMIFNDSHSGRPERCAETSFLAPVLRAMAVILGLEVRRKYNTRESSTPR